MQLSTVYEFSDQLDTRKVEILSPQRQARYSRYPHLYHINCYMVAEASKLVESMPLTIIEVTEQSE